jgi:hypothetical protein
MDPSLFQGLYAKCRAAELGSTVEFSKLTIEPRLGGAIVQGTRSIGSGATLLAQDIPACKAFVNEISSVLYPFFSLKPPSAQQVLQPISMPASCTAEYGANYQGEEVSPALQGAPITTPP